MAEIVNLRQTRKTKARAEREDHAGENRAKFGVPKALRSVAKARSEKNARDLDGNRLDPDKTLEK